MRKSHVHDLLQMEEFESYFFFLLLRGPKEASVAIASYKYLLSSHGTGSALFSCLDNPSECVLDNLKLHVKGSHECRIRKTI